MPEKVLEGWQGEGAVPRHGVFPLTGNSNSARRALIQQCQYVVAPAKAAVCDKGAKALA